MQCALSVNKSSSIPNFSFTKSVIMLSLFSHVSLVSSRNSSKRRLFRQLRPSKSTSFFFDFVTKSSVTLYSLISSTLLLMSSSFLLTSSTFSLCYCTLFSVNYFLIFLFSSFKTSTLLSNLSIVLLNTFNSIFSCIYL